jgi:hypothetical protein
VFGDNLKVLKRYCTAEKVIGVFLDVKAPVLSYADLSCDFHSDTQKTNTHSTYSAKHFTSIKFY